MFSRGIKRSYIKGLAREELLTQLEDFIVLGSQVQQITKEIKEMRFSKGIVCCHCAGTYVVRNGKNKELKGSYAEVAIKYLSNYLKWHKWMGTIS